MYAPAVVWGSSSQCWRVQSASASLGALGLSPIPSAQHDWQNINTACVCVCVNLPACGTEGLASTADSDSSIPHPWKCSYYRGKRNCSMRQLVIERGPTHSDVFCSRVGEPLVHLIHETDDIIPLAQLCHHLQLLPREHLTHRQL